MNERQPDTEDRSVSVGGDLVGSAIVTGDNNIVSVVYQTLTGKEAIEQADSIRNLQFLLAKVKTFWIGGVLEASIDDGVIPIEKLTQHQAVERPFEGQLKLARSAEKPKVVDRVADSFDEAGNSLLILGQPGGGKTMTMLELARDLISRAEQNIEQPVPVVFLLSSWPGPEVSLDQWIEDELSSQYQIPRDIGHIWLQRKKLLPLLDGLDEVDSEEQSSCVEAIHGFLERVGVPGLAVSSRAEEYQLLPSRLKLGGAICLQPLSEEQVRQFIADGRIKNKQLSELLNRHETLRHVVQSPLMFDIVTDAFVESVELAEGVTLDSEADCRTFLFDAYVDRMLEEEQPSLPPADDATNEKFLGWLSWLGRRLIDNQKSMFLLEEIHPGWLTSATARFMNVVLVSLVVGLISGIVITLASMGIAPVLDALTLDPLTQFMLLIQVPLWVLAIGMVDVFTFKRDASHLRRGSVLVRGCIKAVCYYAIWMIWPLLILLIASMPGGISMKDWFTFNAMTGLIVCSFFGSISRCDRLTVDIPTVEALGISWKKALQGAFIGGVSGMIVYWIYFIMVPTESFPYFWKDAVEIYSFFAYPACGAIVGLCVGGIVPRIDETKVSVNQGIRLSRRNALITGFGSAIVCAVPGVLMLVMMRVLGIKDYSFTSCLWAGMGFGMLMGFFAGLWFGGLSVFKHYILRWHLAVRGQLPMNISTLLERATNLRLMRRVGGGFMFAHGLLREHFATKTFRPGPSTNGSKDNESVL